MSQQGLFTVFLSLISFIGFYFLVFDFVAYKMPHIPLAPSNRQTNSNTVFPHLNAKMRFFFHDNKGYLCNLYFNWIILQWLLVLLPVIISNNT